MQELKFVRRFQVFAVLLIVLAVAGMSFNFYTEIEKLTKSIFLQQARALFKEIVITRRWVAENGGVFVRVRPEVNPNPYLTQISDLKVSHRDEQGNLYTLQNPALVTREISEVADKSGLYKFHVASLKPVNTKANSPDAFETEALKRFEKGEKEFSLIVNTEQGPVYRYMAPLYFEESCNMCHANQGYKPGDIRGGISITIPMSEVIHKLAVNKMRVISSAIVLLGLLLGILYILSIKFSRSLSSAQEKLVSMATTDGLTGLPNRTLFSDRLSSMLASAHRNKEMFAVLFLDLDNFKAINDTLGHDIGDKLLKGVAERLKKCLRENDTVSRLGGDEFTILLPGIKASEDAVKVARKILNTLKTPFSFNGQELYVTTSIGISLYPYDGKDAQVLLKNADIALYRAKDQGRNKYELHSPSMSAKAFEKLVLENSICKALDREEFTLYYQPQVSLDSCEIVGMEALLRWRHPEFDMVYPSEILPVLEETGLVHSVGKWAIDTACRQGKTWHDNGHPVRIAVNISARQLDKSLVNIVDNALSTSGFNSEFLEIEVTEGVIMKDTETAATVLYELRKMGVKISLDDFATGYSSLSYLKKFSVDALKIDQSFIDDIMYDPDNLAIANAILTLAHSLNLRAVAEGVETPEQVEFLRSLKCDEIQGYVFSKPLVADEATELLRKNLRLCA